MNDRKYKQVFFLTLASYVWYGAGWTPGVPTARFCSPSWEIFGTPAQSVSAARSDAPYKPYNYIQDHTTSYNPLLKSDLKAGLFHPSEWLLGTKVWIYLMYCVWIGYYCSYWNIYCWLIHAPIGALLRWNDYERTFLLCN